MSPSYFFMQVLMLSYSMSALSVAPAAPDDLTASAADANAMLRASTERALAVATASDQKRLPVPPKPQAPRRFGPELQMKAAVLVEAIRREQDARGTLVTADHVMTTARAGGDEAVLTATSNGCRFSRVLEPALADGRVTCTREHRRVYYGVSGHAADSVPGIAGRSDLSKVEEALARAVRAASGAVPSDAVQAELARDSALAFAIPTTPLHVHLQSLTTTGRAHVVRHPDVSGAGRVYYTTPGGPTRVARGADLLSHRRMRAVRALWKAAGGRPFTTAALRRFANARETLRIEADPPYGWTSALHALERAGQVVAIREEGRRTVRWAPAAEWDLLAPATQDERVIDLYRVVEVDVDAEEGRAMGEGASGAANSRGVDSFEVPARHDDLATRVGLVGGAPAHDVNFASRNENARTLIALAKCRAMEREVDPARREIVGARPVCAAQLDEVGEAHPHLLRGAESALGVIHGACRRRKTMVRSAVVRVGVVGRTAFYDVALTAAATTFVSFRSAVRAGRTALDWSARAELADACGLTAAGVSPLSPGILAARAAALAETFDRQCTTLEAAVGAIALLPEEEREATALTRELRAAIAEMRDLAARWAPRAAPVVVMQTVPVGTAVDGRITAPVLDSAQAWNEIAAVAHFDLENPRLLSARMRTSRNRFSIVAPVQQKSDDATGIEPSTVRSGRRVTVGLDRVAFACLAAVRWGGPEWAVYAGLAAYALGELRDATPFMLTLADPTQRAAHAAAAAALGFVDDAAARTALRRYLDHWLDAAQALDDAAPVGALASAAFGLAPKPVGGVATALSDDERVALTRLAEWHIADGAGAAARRALHAWEGGLESRRRLLL